MRKGTFAIGILCVILLVSVIGNVYLAKERHVLLNTGSIAYGDADAHLQVAVNMPIESQPDNTLGDRAIEVATSAGYLTSAAHALNKEGVGHLEGIAQALYRFSFDLPYPRVFGKTKVNDEWKWIVMTAHDIHADDGADGVDLAQLNTDIGSLYKSMPVSNAQRNAYYSAPLQ